MPPPPSATDQRLRHTIAKRMRMSPIDQPLMRMERLGPGGSRRPRALEMKR